MENQVKLEKVFVCIGAVERDEITDKTDGIERVGFILDFPAESLRDIIGRTVIFNHPDKDAYRKKLQYNFGTSTVEEVKIVADETYNIITRNTVYTVKSEYRDLN